MTVMLSSKSDSSCGVPVRGVSHAFLSSYPAVDTFSSAEFPRSSAFSSFELDAATAGTTSGVVVVTVASGDGCIFDSSA